MKARRWVCVFILLVVPGAVACSASADAKQGTQSAPPAAESPAQAAARPTGTIIEVEMITDGDGNTFEPSRIEARPGDVLRFAEILD